MKVRQFTKNEQRVLTDALECYRDALDSWLSDVEPGDEVEGVKADRLEVARLLMRIRD
jgi:hypothetical protein